MPAGTKQVQSWFTLQRGFLPNRVWTPAIKWISIRCSVLSLKYQTPLWFSQLCTSSRQSLLHCSGSKQAVPRPTPFLWQVHCSHTKQIQGGKYKHYRVSVEWLYKRSMPAPTSSAASLQQEEHQHISISMLHARDVRSKLEVLEHSPKNVTKHCQIPWGLEQVITEVES